MPEINIQNAPIEELSEQSLPSIEDSSQEPVFGIDFSIAAADDNEDFGLDDEIASTPESEAAEKVAELERTYASYATDPVGTAVALEYDGLPPVDQEDFSKWLTSQDPDAQHTYKAGENATEARHALAERTHDNLTATVPELYRGKLPESLALKLGDTPYAVGFNQSEASNIGEARKYLEEESGISVTGFNYDQRFLMYDESMGVDENDPSITGVIDSGYTGMSEIGRFVVAFPAVNLDPAQADAPLAHLVNVDSSVLPEDFEVSPAGSTEGDKRSVSTKYVAGYIDDLGDFWENKNFATSDQPDFVKVVKTGETHRATPQETVALGEYALTGAADLDSEWLEAA